MIALDKQMGDAIIEKDVVLLIMVLNGQHENIMHDMMQFMVLFHYFMRKFLVRDTSAFGVYRKLNCERSDIKGWAILQLNRPNFIAKGSGVRTSLREDDCKHLGPQGMFR